jgi:hypothetical protein
LPGGFGFDFILALLVAGANAAGGVGDVELIGAPGGTGFFGGPVHFFRFCFFFLSVFFSFAAGLLSSGDRLRLRTSTRSATLLAAGSLCSLPAFVAFFTFNFVAFTWPGAGSPESRSSGMTSELRARSRLMAG